MEPTDRRQFLRRSTAVAAAAGIAAAVPTSAAQALTRTAKESEQRLPDHPSVDVPVVAHVVDVRKGVVSLYTGEREIKVKNKKLAAALYHATR